MRAAIAVVALLAASPVLADQTLVQRHCSEQADAMNLHGAERMAFRAKCKGNDGYSVVATQPTLNKSIRLGMTADQVRSSWGNPRSINATITARGKHEQWVYGIGQYVYLTDGVVTTIQTSR